MNFLKLCYLSQFVFYSILTRSSPTTLISKEPRKPKDYVLCRSCGSDVASAESIAYLRSPAATKKVNETLFGQENVFIQTLVNPLNIEFKIVTILESSCLTVGKDWTAEHSWFPGYTWKPCVCPRCGKHLGWAFEPLETADRDKVQPSHKGFYALILDNTISELYSDQLLIAPKTFTVR